MTPRSKGAATDANAGRVIAGTARGIRLVGPGEGTRPLGDRLKQSLFAILEPRIRERAFLDLFAGSGAAGIEALSRGAARAVFVERDRRAIGAIEANLSATGLAVRATIVRADANSWLDSNGKSAGPFGNLFLDPPYTDPELLPVSLAAISSAGPDGILATGGVIVAKQSARQALPAEVALLRSTRQERFGDTILTFYRWADEVDA
jgi:16S rRNA (guanine(966)-N(2))-methyltransferase RsmD